MLYRLESIDRIGNIRLAYTWTALPKYMLYEGHLIPDYIKYINDVDELY